MGTYTQIIYQIVFSTKYRDPVMIKKNRDELYGYISGIIRNKKCVVYKINGVEDHLHILTDLHPSIALADLIKDIKIASSKYIKEKNLFPGFIGWQSGYGAFTYSADRKKILINYIKNQEVHHLKKSYHDESVELLREHAIDYEENYLF